MTLSDWWRGGRGLVDRSWPGCWEPGVRSLDTEELLLPSLCRPLPVSLGRSAVKASRCVLWSQSSSVVVNKLRFKISALLRRSALLARGLTSQCVCCFGLILAAEAPGCLAEPWGLRREGLGEGRGARQEPHGPRFQRPESGREGEGRRPGLLLWPPSQPHAAGAPWSPPPARCYGPCC